MVTEERKRRQGEVGGVRERGDKNKLN